MTTEKIHVVISEPTTDFGVGCFEWRIDPVEAERLFRQLRGNEASTYLYNDVTVPEELREDHDAITVWVDTIYWNYGHTPAEMHKHFGTDPTRVHSR